MATLFNGRMTAKLEGDFVVLLLGMRINRWWKFHQWIPVALAMPRMLRELKKKPELGLLGYEIYGVVSPVVIQYWRSYDLLEKYASSVKHQHQPAWRAFNQRVFDNGDVGLWHETYWVKAGQYETIYTNMPKRGLGAVGNLQKITQKTESSRERLNAD
jgi:hypothetical protein